MNGRVIYVCLLCPSASAPRPHHFFVEIILKETIVLKVTATIYNRNETLFVRLCATVSTKQFCVCFLKSPAKGVTVPYRPKLAAMATPVLVAANGQTYALPPGQFIIPQPSTVNMSFYLCMHALIYLLH